jgi:hypothetical protein
MAFRFCRCELTGLSSGTKYVVQNTEDIVGRQNAAVLILTRLGVPDTRII